MQFFPGMAPIVDPSFRLIVNLGELMGSFNQDLDAEAFVNIQHLFPQETVGYMARGMIHKLLGIPGGLTIAEATQFFPYETHKIAKRILEFFWMQLSSEIARLESIVRFQNPGRSFDMCGIPAPMIEGYSNLIIWYHWKTPEMIQMEQEPLDLEDEEQPELITSLGF